MKVWKISILAVLFAPLCFGQLEPTELRLVGGKNLSSFIYRDDANQKDEQLQYNLLNAFGVSLNLEGGKHQLRPELMFRQAGARSSYENLSLSWELNYLNLSVAYLYEVARLGMFSLSPGVGVNGAFLLSGDQYIGEQRLSVIEEESIRRLYKGAQGIANARAFVTDNITLSLEYRFGIGVTQIENDINDQMTRNIYHGVLFGIGFNLSKEQTRSRFN